MAKKNQVRELTDVEKEWIKDHYVKDKMTLEDLATKLPGVDLNEIKEYVEKLYVPPKPEQSFQERQQQLANMPPAGQFMGRDREKGVTVMTQAASEITDAKIKTKASTNDMARAKPDRIKIIDPNRRAR